MDGNLCKKLKKIKPVVGLNVFPVIKIINLLQCDYFGPCRVASTLRSTIFNCFGGLHLKTERKRGEKGKKGKKERVKNEKREGG
jgi:hypothetical protein